jgi:hypothetical protein
VIAPVLRSTETLRAAVCNAISSSVLCTVHADSGQLVVMTAGLRLAGKADVGEYSKCTIAGVHTCNRIVPAFM